MAYCMGYCLLAVILVSVYISGMFIYFNNSYKTFKNSLLPSQQIIFEKITKQRMKITMMGLIIGIVLCSVFLINNNLPYKVVLCNSIIIILGTAYIVYKLVNKEYIINYLNYNQINLWNKSSISIQKQMMVFVILGIIIWGLFIRSNIEF